MLKKRILGIIIAVIGVLCLLTSFYIKSQVSDGRVQIADAEAKVRKGKELFSLNPVTKEAGKVIMDPIDKKIQAGTAEADRYAAIAMWLQIGGGIFIVIGGWLIFISRKKK